ncbi:hypothetical protein H477_0517 [[Clostridium] sordellii ATCC 9714]|nr:hypothetical protein H477_0517 [[Clostridium] sordellii ATCC 9714] [Paeniclostridium sordellii ATCC 9714]
MDFIDNKVANRLGGISFFKNSDNLYKFEKVKKLQKKSSLKIQI